MPSPVNSRPTPSTLAGRQVGQPVSAAHGRRWAQEINHLRAYAVPPVIAQAWDYAAGASGTYDVWLLYRRTPGVMVLRVALRLDTNQIGGATVYGGTLAISYGTDPTSLTSATMIGPSSVFNGVANVSAPSPRISTRETHVAYVDVSSWSTSAVIAVRVRLVAASATNGQYDVNVSEVPLPTVDPVGDPTNEAGVNESEFDYRNRIYQGLAGTRGMLRVFSELDAARSQVRRHIGIARRSDLAYSVNSLTNTDLASGGVWHTRARRLYDSSTANRYTFAVLYSYDPTYATLTNSYVRVTAAAISGSSVTSTLQLTDTGGALALGTVAATVPCDGTDQIAALTFDARTSNTNGVSTTSDAVTVYALALIEDET